MTTTELAAATGIHRTTLSRWLNGQRSLTTAQACRVMVALGLVIAVGGCERPPVIGPRWD